jgi:hypothetical protein
VIFKRELPEAHEVESGSAKAGFDRVAKLERIHDQAASISDRVTVGEVSMTSLFGGVVATEPSDIVAMGLAPGPAAASSDEDFETQPGAALWIAGVFDQSVIED